MRTRRLSLVGLVTTALVCGSAAAAAQEASSGVDLLPGVDLVTEEVEPGVFRVANDGARDLSSPIEFVWFWEGEAPGMLYRNNAMAMGGLAANDDGVWLGTGEGIVRLGEEGLIWELGSDPDWWNREFDAAPDGRLFRSSNGRILKEDEWSAVKARADGFEAGNNPTIRFAPDGSLWAKGTNGRPRDARRDLLAVRDEDGWSRVKAPPTPPGRGSERQAPRIGDFGVAGDGTVYVVRSRRDVQRFDGSKWETLERPGGSINSLQVGPEGSVWVRTQDPDRPYFEEQLSRAEGDAWVAHELPRRYLRSRADDTIGADGAYWYAASGDLMTTGGCDGAVRYDGTSTTRFLPGECIYDMDIGPGGDMWLLASTWDGNYHSPESVGPVEVYVITSEAVS